MTPELSIVIVTYNSRADIAICLASLEKHCRAHALEIIVFDNASKDGTADEVAAKFPNVRLLRSAENHGFARGNNLAAQHAQGRFILLLNPDTWVNDDMCGVLVRFMNEHPEAGACAPLILRPDGSRQRGAFRTLPTLATLFYDQTGLSRIFPKSRRFGRYMMTWWNHDDVRAVEQPAGACLLVRREVWQHINGFDEGYFMYYDDVDLCRAILQAGWKIYFTPHTRVYHSGGQSASQDVLKNYIELHRSMYRYFRKHHGRVATWIAKLLVACGELGKLLVIAFLMITEKFRPRTEFWGSRREQFRGHGRLLLQHWLY
ncbi:glycosyltransferase family 2 protein [candidate division KSB1 bacterium]|nr:glycosyltransferase family 2 protein [candidate division KSB1 bacterium]